MSIYNRDQLLSDLRKQVIEIHTQNGSLFRCTLLNHFLPEEYSRVDSVQVQDLNEFHNISPTRIIALNVNTGKFVGLEMDGIVYVNAVDSYS
jgi:hypothetical protein